MTLLAVDVQLDEHGQPVLRLTPAQAAALGLQGSESGQVRWEVWVAQAEPSPLAKYIGIAPPLEEGSLEFYRQLKGHAE